MTLKELKQWKCRAEKCVEIYKNNGKDTSTAKVTIPVNKFLDLTDTANKALEQQEKTGHWIDTDEWRETVDGFEQWGYFRKCSKCGYVFKFLEIDNYCPNCGARMVSE